MHRRHHKQFLLYKTSRKIPCCHALIINRSQKTLKCGKNNSDTLGFDLVCNFIVPTTFWRHSNLLRNRRRTTWDPFVKCNTNLRSQVSVIRALYMTVCLHNIHVKVHQLQLTSHRCYNNVRLYFAAKSTWSNQCYSSEAAKQ